MGGKFSDQQKKYHDHPERKDRHLKIDIMLRTNQEDSLAKRNI